MNHETTIRQAPAWILSTAPSHDWAEHVERLDGGVFHTPVALRLAMPEGTPVYARYVIDDQVCGIALGVRTACRLSGRPRHAYFPAAPALAPAPGISRWAALVRLQAALTDDQVAEVCWDSFDGGSTGPESSMPTRCEYVLDLSAIDGVWPPSRQHRRALGRGEREGWTLGALTGEAARSALTQVVTRMVERATTRGDAFTVTLPAAAGEGADDGCPWHATTWAAFAGDTLLAAVLIGRGGRRAYYLMGGATSEGYRRSASAWLHARLAARFAAEGLTRYNLGGTPVGARSADDPFHGLHAFKCGFGPRVIGCAGDRWILQGAHLQGHRFLRWATGWVW
jgi:hypothetical protein